MATSKIRYVDYAPRGACKELFRRKEKRLIVAGPAGTGKSRACLEKVNYCADKYPMLRALMVRKTRSSLTNTAIVTYEQEVLLDRSVTFHGGDQEYRYPNGATLGVAGLDKASKIMSSQYDLIYTPEATEFSQEDIEALTTRLRNGCMPYQQWLADCNPDRPTHFLKVWANTGSAVMLESRHEDNPVLWDGERWTERGVAYLATLDELTGVRYLRLRKGVWAAAEGIIYADWNRGAHVVPWREIPKSWPRYWAVDFGYTNPFVWQAWAEDPDGRLWRYHEIYRTQMLVEDHAREILRVCDGEPVPRAIICDHDAEDRATLERHLNMETLPAYKSVSPGIQAVQARMKTAGDGKPRVLFMENSLVARDEKLAAAHKPTCTEDEVEGYVWDKRVVRGSDVDEPLKRDDHGCDAARYMVAFVDSVAVEPMAPPEGTVTYYDPQRISPF